MIDLDRMSPEELAQFANECAADVHEAERLRKLSNEELVQFVVQSAAWDFPVVREMMNRLHPKWRVV